MIGLRKSTEGPRVQDPTHVIGSGMLARREIIVAGGINYALARDVIVTLEHLASVSREPIRVVIVSPGGSVFDGLAIYDTMRSIVARGVPVVTEARGWAASMGIVLLQAGSQRTATAHTRLLIHSVSASNLSGANIWDAEEQAQEMKRLNGVLVGIIAERSGLSAEEIEQRSFKKDWWLGVEEALELGLVDRVV